MSTADKTFLRKLGLKQKEVAEALKRTPQTVSSGIAMPRNYFDRKKFNLLESHVLKYGGISRDEFLQAKHDYLSEETDEEGHDRAKASQTDSAGKFDQLWVFTNSTEAAGVTGKILEIIASLSGQTDKIVLIAVPDSRSVDLCFQLLARSLSGNETTPQVYLFEMPEADTPVVLYLRDAHLALSGVFTESKDGAMVRLPDRIGNSYICLFNEHGFGLGKDELYAEENMLKITERLSLRYKTDNFVDQNRKYLL